MNSLHKLTAEKLLSMGADSHQAQIILEILENHGDEPAQCWQELTRQALASSSPARLHHELFMAVYQQDEKYSDAPPAWFPDKENEQNTNLNQLIKKWGLSAYDDLYRYSVTQKEAFWEGMIDIMDIPFKVKAKKVVDFSGGVRTPKWLPGARFNIAEACFNAPEEKTAIVFGKESGQQGQLTYGQLRVMASRVAHGFKELGFGKGDRAAIDMPMTAEAVAIYLGIVMAGGVVVSIADSLAPAEVDKRLRIADASLLFTQDVLLRGDKSLPLYEKLLEVNPVKTIVLPAKESLQIKLRNDDLSWAAFLSEKKDFIAEECNAADYCNILFSSGTTGDPKAIPWTHTTPIKAAADGFAHQDIHGEDIVAWPTNIGWMMGPWLIFASLINQSTMALFYGAPTGQPFGKFVQEAGVTILGVVPSMVRRWKQDESLRNLDWSRIRLFSSTGESSNPQDYLWLMAQAGYKPVIEYCGGTEIGGGYLTGSLLQPASPAAFSTPALGLDALILDDHERPCSEGELFLVPPSMGLSNELLNKDHDKVYYEGIPEARADWKSASGILLGEQAINDEKPLLRKHGDEFRKLNNGFFRAQGRADDTMNLGGIKTSSVEIERLLDSIEGVQETAAVAVEPPYGGPNQLVIYCKLSNSGNITKERLFEQFQDRVKKELNPLFKVADVIIIENLPRTASNKIMRRVLRDQYEQKESK